jgi:[ribosomal protein S18]-alanine N-acetyltransferase
MRWWDIEGILEIERSVFGADAWTAEQFWSELAQVPLSRWYVVAEEEAEEEAEAGPRVLGYAGLACAGGDADVQTLAVRPSRQGAGVGSALFDALLGEASRRGCARVFLEVRADNDAAIGLYARRGFERAGVRRAYYTDGTDAVVMRGRIGRRDP